MGSEVGSVIEYVFVVSLLELILGYLYEHNYYRGWVYLLGFTEWYMHGNHGILCAGV